MQCYGTAVANPSTQAPASFGRSLCFRKGQVTLRKELLAHLGIQPGQRIGVEVLPGGRLKLHAEQATGTIRGFIGLLADRSSHRASLDELIGTAASGCPIQLIHAGPVAAAISQEFLTQRHLALARHGERSAERGWCLGREIGQRSALTLHQA